MNRPSVIDLPNAVAHLLTFERAARLFPFVAAMSAAASIALVEYKVWRTPHFAYVPVVVTSAAIGFALSIVVAAILHRAASSQRIRASSAVSWVAAVAVGILLLPVAVLLLARGIREDEITGWMFPVVNKRWLVFLYNLAIGTVLVFPVAIERWRSWSSDDDAGRPDVGGGSQPSRSWIDVAAGLTMIVSLCWFLGGPPWHLERHHRALDWHEQLHFEPLLAVHQGYLPYVGPAATPYGPAAQRLIVGLMKLRGSFDLVSFRTAWAIQQFVAVLAVGVAAWWWLGAIPAVAVVLLSFTYSPIAFFQTASDGTWGGLFGWSNACRYLAPMLVIPILAESAVRESRTWPIAVLGALWAVGALLAQENLTTTATAAILLLTLLCLTRTVTLAQALRVLRGLVLGFVCVVAPVIVYYAWHGAAGEFIRTYFFFARAVVAGFSNSWWPPQDAARPDRISYLLTLPFLLACGVCALWRVPQFDVAPLDRTRRRFLAFILVMLVCFQTALLRSDAAHVMNTLIALPFVVVSGAIHLPAWLASRPSPRWLLRAAFVVIVLLVYPALRAAGEWRRFIAPAARFETRQSSPLPIATDAGIAFERMTPLLVDDAPMVPGSTVSVREFLQFATTIRQIVGSRKTYFLQLGWTTTGSLIAFMADLQIAPHPIGGELLNLNDEVTARVAEHIRTHPAEYGAFIGPSLDAPEARAFLESHPGAVRMEEPLGSAIVHIVLAPGS